MNENKKQEIIEIMLDEEILNTVLNSPDVIIDYDNKEGTQIYNLFLSRGCKLSKIALKSEKELSELRSFINFFNKTIFFPSMEKYYSDFLKAKSQK